MANEEFIKVGARGVVTLPKSFRDQFGLDRGSVLSAVIEDDAIVIRPTPPRALSENERRRLLEQANAGYQALREDPSAWSEHRAEADEWDTTLSDGDPDA